MDTFQLYIGILQDTDEDVRFSFYEKKTASTLDYMLVYSDKQPDGSFVKCDDKVIAELTSSEKKWLTLCKLTVNSEAMAKNEETYAELLAKFADLLEQELRKERSRINGGGEQSDTRKDNV